MRQVIWTLPLPSTAVVEHPSLKQLPGRELELLFALQEEEDEEPRRFRIRFRGVESFKWTSLTSCSEEMITSAYDKVIDCGDSGWLQECREISSRVGAGTKELHHYRIFFDEGPCFEVIGESVSGF
jgi:hypothetical protein